MVKNFRVLVVDDKKPVLQALDDRIEKKVIIGHEEFLIELLLLHVEVVGEEGKYEFSQNTIENLHNFCQKAFDLMLLDFGYVKKGVNAEDRILELQEKNPEKDIRLIVDDIVLNPKHLVNRCKVEYKYLSKIKEFFINHKGIIIVYTFIPSRIERHYTSANVRENITNKVFIKANISVIDTRKELFNDSQFDEIKKKYEGYYPFLISKYLSKIIQFKIAETLLLSSKIIKSDIKKIKRNSKSISLATILLSLFTGIFIPGLSDSIQRGEYIHAISFFVSMSLLIILFTVGNKVLEKKNEKISSSINKRFF
jgi:hypothetical protein